MSYLNFNYIIQIATVKPYNEYNSLRKDNSKKHSCPLLLPQLFERRSLISVLLLSLLISVSDTRSVILLSFFFSKI